MITGLLTEKGSGFFWFSYINANVDNETHQPTHSSSDTDQETGEVWTRDGHEDAAGEDDLAFSSFT